MVPMFIPATPKLHSDGHCAGINFPGFRLDTSHIIIRTPISTVSVAPPCYGPAPHIALKMKPRKYSAMPLAHDTGAIQIRGVVAQLLLCLETDSHSAHGFDNPLGRRFVLSRSRAGFHHGLQPRAVCGNAHWDGQCRVIYWRSCV